MTRPPTTPPATATDHAEVLVRLADVLASRLPAPGDEAAAQTSYVAKLYAGGPDAFLKKIGEEATELVMAAKDGDAARIVAETADLWFHSLVMLAYYGLRPESVLQELARREGRSGLAEKASRVQAGAASVSPDFFTITPHKQEPA